MQTKISSSIRLLTRADGGAYQQLRLQSLQQNPEAFLSLYENERKLHEKIFADHLDWADHPPHFGYFGIFVDNQGDTDNGGGKKLAGYVQVARTFLDKQAHVVLLNNLYIAPEFRGQGLASALFDYVFSVLKTSEAIERIFLSCAGKNKPALQFYRKMGFQRYGVKVRAIKWDNQYDDEVEMVKVV